MKKALTIVLSLLCAAALLAGCTTNPPAASESASAETPVETSEAPVTSEAAAPSQSEGYDLIGGEPITIVFAIPNGAANIETVFSEQWMELVKERSEGLISFDYTNAGALGSYAELLEGVENGVYDMSITDPSYIQAYVPESVVLTLPMLYNDYAHAEAVFSGEVGDWYKGLVAEKTNINVLNYYFCGFRYICSEKPINSLADCDGVLIRSPQIQVYNDLLGLMGFSYVNMAWSEAYTSMSTGVIDAVEVPLQNIYEAGFYDLAKNICETRHLLSVNCVIASDAFWSGLPDVYKQIMTDALAEITAAEHEEIATREADYKTKLEGEGCTFSSFDTASKAELLEIFSEYWNTQVDALGADAIDQLNKILVLKG
jgi:TRAP-type C4-dicarboxylate transport system substrate-binding protein